MKNRNGSNRRTGRDTLRRLVLSAMFMAIGLTLPFLTGQIPQIGSMLLPMHIPVFLCGLICGWQYGACVGLILPIFRSLLFAMPPLYPTAVSMSVELCIYGLAVGFIFCLFRKQSLLAVYTALVSSMILGRIAWGGCQAVLLSMEGSTFTFSAFIAGALFNAVPGIILQLLLIPAVMTSLRIVGLRKSRERIPED